MIKEFKGSLLRGARRLSLAALLIVGSAAPALAADAVFYRIFLRDGSTLVSYGEFARVAGQVVFSLPIGGLETASPQLQLVSLAESVVDWDRTDRYAEAARAKQYGETRGEIEFAALSNRVAATLSNVAKTDDPARRLALADQARRMLADWPSRNYGYRASDVSQLSSLLDEVVSELRVAAGLSRFDLSLVAMTAPVSYVPLLPSPTLRESIEQALVVSRTSTDPAQRVSLLKAVNEALAGPSESGGWAAALRARVSADLTAETRVDRAYAELSQRVLSAAQEKKRRADVKGIQDLVKQVLKRDDRLGRSRPQATSALLATLDLRLNEARHLQLEHDRWALRLETVRAYERRAKSAFDQLARAKPTLELIRQLAGPSAKSLPQAHKRILGSAREFSLIKPSGELANVHGILTSSFQMAILALDARIRAARSNDMTVAWEASSAAAGALLLFESAREELQRLLAPPNP
jgi:hypothetical protein